MTRRLTSTSICYWLRDQTIIGSFANSLQCKYSEGFGPDDIFNMIIFLLSSQDVFFFTDCFQSQCDSLVVNKAALQLRV